MSRERTKLITALEALRFTISRFETKSTQNYLRTFMNPDGLNYLRADQKIAFMFFELKLSMERRSLTGCKTIYNNGLIEAAS
jgi:hypothetical protein